MVTEREIFWLIVFHNFCLLCSLSYSGIIPSTVHYSKGLYEYEVSPAQCSVALRGRIITRYVWDGFYAEMVGFSTLSLRWFSEDY